MTRTTGRAAGKVGSVFCGFLGAIALAAVAGCNMGGGGSGTITRYEGQEVEVTGAITIPTPLPARKAADTSAESVQTLQAGQSVSRKAEFGNFTLVTWSGPDGKQQEGWIETSSASNAQKPSQVAPKPPALPVQPQNCPSGSAWNGSACAPVPAPVPTPAPTPAPAQKCTPGNGWDGTACAPAPAGKPNCANGFSWDGSQCAPAPAATGGWGGPGPAPTAAQPACPGGSAWNGTACQPQCTGNTAWNGKECAPKPAPTAGGWGGPGPAPTGAPPPPKPGFKPPKIK